MRVAVAGGTGVVGRHVVARLSAQGHEPVVLARTEGVDLVSRDGLDEALEGIQAVIDVSNLQTVSRRTSLAFFEATASNLLDAGSRAGVHHLVVLSIVGVDRVDTGYYAGKLRQEQLVLSGPVPATVLRATQFHEFADQVVARGAGPLVVVPQMLSQPVAAREVAEHLVELVLQPSAGLAPEMAGPEELPVVDMVRSVCQARRRRCAVVPLRVPGAAGRLMAAGGLLPEGTGPRGTQRFADWLAASVADAGEGAVR